MTPRNRILVVIACTSSKHYVRKQEEILSFLEIQNTLILKLKV